MKTKTAVFLSLFCAGLLPGTAPLAQANTLVTFQVDMTAQVQGATFNPATDTVWARGSFNGWGNFVLTNNPSGANTNLYTGTYDDTVDTNGAQLDYKFATSVIGYESTANGPGDNRATLLPVTSGSSLVLPVQFFSDAGSPVAYPCVFQVNLAQQIVLGVFNPNTDTVEVQGDFEGWTSGYTLTNDPSILTTNQVTSAVNSNVYVGTYLIAGSPGQVNEFKYVIQPINKYEFPSALNGVGQNNNRFVFVVSNQTLPDVYFSDQATTPVVTNSVTFSVDMTDQIISGVMSNQQVRLSGDFNNWDSSGTHNNICTNNPSASNTNIYSCTVNFTNGVNTTTQFKFGYVNGNWEINPSHTYPGNPSVSPGNNRNFNMPDVNNANVALPTVYFNDTSPNSVLPAATMVTFSVNMTNAVGTDAHVFNPNTDSVYLNGLVLTNGGPSLNSVVPGYAFAPWTNNPTGNPLGNFLMQNNPLGSEIYTIQLPIPGGYPAMVSYQYSINGNPDEALNFTNHIRYIRTTGNYVMPLDKFGSMVQEQSFGNLVAGPKSGGSVPITWLGRPGVHLQTRTNLTTGAWLDVSGTDGQSSTNYPVGSGASYFRLINPF